MKPFERILNNGVEGDDVLQLQQRLIDLHFDKCNIENEIGQIEPNGIYGDVTEQCIKNFQEKVKESVNKANIDELKQIERQYEDKIVEGEVDYYTWYILKNLEDICSYYKIELLPNDYEEPEEIKEPETEEIVTKEQLKYIFRCSDATIDLHFESINKTLKTYNIVTPLRIQHFLAQVGHESCGLKYMEEIASGSAYEGRADLGNIYKGDGRLFKGRGPIQITGRHNYTMYFNSIGRPELIETPQILSTDLDLCWGATGWFWKSRNLNLWADKDKVREITRRVNGGYNGLSDRIEYLNRAKKIIN